jgi:uncharacterized DUF497 family protein
VKFEWDETKAANNLKKHHISFNQAALVFIDPFVMTICDIDHSYEEDREISMGLVPQGNILVVVHTSRQRAGTEWIRIISARQADKLEESVYFTKRKSHETPL